MKWIDEYDSSAKDYDRLVKLYDDWLGIDMMHEREQFADYIPAEGVVRMLDVSTGTAANFEAIVHRLGAAACTRLDLHGVDLSMGMLRVAREKMRSLGLDCLLVQANVYNLPYPDDQFDVVLHSGGMNTFSNIAAALEEMLRLVRPEGTVVVVDEGLSPRVRASERGREVIETNNLFASRPPLEHLPSKARDVKVDYIMNETFYRVVFRK